MNDIHRLSGLGPSIKEYTSLHAVFRSGFSLPTACQSLYHWPYLFQRRHWLTSFPSSHTHRCLHSLCSPVTFSKQHRPSYCDLDMWDVQNPDTLWILLVMWQDLMSLMHTLHIPTWPSAQTPVYLIPLTQWPSLTLTPSLLSSHAMMLLCLLYTWHPALWHTSPRRVRLSFLHHSMARPMWSPSNFHSCVMRMMATMCYYLCHFPPPQHIHNTYPVHTHHTKPTVHASSIYSQFYNSRCLVISDYPPRAFPSSNQCIYHHFCTNLYWISTYDHPRVPPFVRSLSVFDYVGKCMEEKTLHTAVVICPDIEELELEDKGGKECWFSIVLHLISLRVLDMCKWGMAQAQTAPIPCENMSLNSLHWLSGGYHVPN